MTIFEDFKSKIGSVVKALNAKEIAKNAGISAVSAINPVAGSLLKVKQDFSLPLPQAPKNALTFEIGKFSPEAKAIDPFLTGTPYKPIKIPSYEEQRASGQIQVKQVGFPKLPQPPMTQQQTQQAQQMFQPTGADIARETVQKSIANAQPWEKPVSVKVPFIPKSVQLTKGAPDTGQRFLMETLKGIVETPEKIVKTIQDFNNVKNSLIKNGSLDEAYNKIKPFDPEDETKVASYAQDYKNLINQDPYFSEHPIQAFSLIASQGVLDIAVTGSVLQNLVRSQIAKLPAELADVTNARLKLGLDLDSTLTEQELKIAYNRVARLTHPDVGGTAAKFTEATNARNLLVEKLKTGPLPGVSKFSQNYGNIIRKIDGDIRNWFKTPEKQAYLGVKGLLPQKAGMKPIQPFQERYQPAVGLSIREVKEVPYKETGNLTTKILKDLEGKTTISKQYILDATNRGELKQAERDITRQVLDTMPDGQINVKEFADKVKSELLPLKRTKVPNPKYEQIDLPDELKMPTAKYEEHIYNSPIKTSAGNVHFSSGVESGGNNYAEGYYGHVRTRDLPSEKDLLDKNKGSAYYKQPGIKFEKGTKRQVIEVQSDLYQKGNLEKEMGLSGKFENTPSAQKIKAEREANAKKFQQYNDPTAHFRMIREEIKQATMDGKTKLQFPTGETAMKIEGIGVAQRNFYPTDGRNGHINLSDLKIGNTIEQIDTTKWIITDVLGDGKFKAVPKENFDSLKTQETKVMNNGKVAKTKAEIEEYDKDLISRWTEQFDISGKVDTQNPIYKFYEKDVGRYLKNKYDAKLIIDNKGVKWWEVDIKFEMSEAVEAFKRPGILDEELISGQEAKQKARELINRFKLKNIDQQIVDIILDSKGEEKFAAAIGNQIYYINEVPKYAWVHEPVHIMHKNADKIELLRQNGITKAKLDAELKQIGVDDIREVLAEKAELKQQYKDSLPPRSIIARFLDVIKKWFQRIFSKDNRTIVQKFLDLVVEGKAKKETYIKSLLKHPKFEVKEGKKIITFQKAQFKSKPPQITKTTPAQPIVPKIPVKKVNNQLTLENRAFEFLDENKQSLKKQYLKDNPVVFDSDIAKKYFEPAGYNSTNAGSFQESASRLTNELFTEQIIIRKGKGNNTVLMTGGGPGVGKSTAISKIKDTSNYPIIYDSSLSNLVGSSKRIDLSLKNGYNVEIVVVLRDPVKAWVNGVLTRTALGERHVRLDSFYDLTYKFPESLMELHKKYADNPKVNFNVISNDGNLDDIKQVEFSKIKEFNNHLIKNKEKINYDILQQTDKAVESGIIKRELLPEIYGSGLRGSVKEGVTGRKLGTTGTIPGIKQTGVTEVSTEKAESLLGKKLPSKNKNGDCYDAAYKYVSNSSDKNLKIVHGMVDGQGAITGIRYDHAWVEDGDMVIDPSNGKSENPLIIPKIVYYSIGNIKESQLLRFGSKEIAENVSRTGKTSGWSLESKKKFVLPTKKARIPTIKQRIAVVTQKGIPEIKITTTEKSLLLKKLTDIKAGASVAKKVEQKVTARQIAVQKRHLVREVGKTRKEERTRIIELFKKKIADVEEIKQSVVNYTKVNISPDNRGKLLDTVKNAKTKGDLAKAMLRIDSITRFEKSREIIGTIKNLSTDINNLPIDVKKKIDNFLSRFKFAGMKDETIQRLLKSKEYFKSGNNLPNRIKMKIQMLEKTNLKDLPIDKLESIKSQLDILVNEGKVKARVKDEIEKLRYEATLKKLKQGSVNLDLEIKKRPPGRPSGQGWLDEKKSNTASLIQTGDFELTFMDRFFDMLDGNKHYQGTNYKTFYEPIKHANDLYLTESTSLSNKMFALQKKLLLTIYDYEKIGMYAVKVQANGVEKLLANGYTQQMIDAIHLTPRQEQMYDFMRKTFDELQPRINKTLEEQYNESLGYIENYFPFQTDFEEMAPTLDQVRKMYRRTSTEKGFTKQRTQAKTPVKIDAGFIFQNYVENALHFIHMNDTIRQLGKIANNPEYGEMIGTKAQKYVQQWIDVLSRKGGVTDRMRLELLNTLRANLGISMLGFKLSSALYQPLAKFNGAAEIGSWAFKHDKEFITKPEIRQFILNSSAELRVRIGDDPGYVDLSENPKWKNIQQKAMWALQRLDSLTAGSIWWGAYRKRLSELGITFDITKTNPEALDYADRVVRLTQASPLYKDLPSAFVNKYRDINKTLLTFQTFMINDWNYIKHDLLRLGITDAKEIKLIDDPTTKAEERAKLINKISQQLLWLIVAAVGQEAISGGLSYMYYGRDYESIKGHLISGLITRIPGLSQLYSLYAYEQIPAPLFGVIENFAKGAKQVVTGKKLETKLRGAVKVTETLGQILGVPGSSEMSKILRGPLPRIFKALKNKGEGENPYR